MQRVLCGDVRECGPFDFVVLRTKRPRRGESGTMVVIGLLNAIGVVHAAETRSYAEVASWPKVGRMRISVREGGGYYAAPWKGRIAAAPWKGGSLDDPDGMTVPTHQGD